MRNFIIAVLTLCATCIWVSCATNKSAPQKLCSFVDDVELKCDSYSQEDWERSKKEFELLVDDYSKSSALYTEEQRQAVAKAMGQYHALLIKHGVQESLDYLQRIVKLIPSYIDGLTSGLNGDLDDSAALVE